MNTFMEKLHLYFMLQNENNVMFPKEEKVLKGMDMEKVIEICNSRMLDKQVGVENGLVQCLVKFGLEKRKVYLKKQYVKYKLEMEQCDMEIGNVDQQLRTVLCK